jgi:hypothetical protein
MLDTMGLSQPAWSVLTSQDEAIEFADTVGYPVLVRPSFVLSGAAMRVAVNETQLRNFLGLAADVAADKPVVVTKFIMDAKEIEFDAVANQGSILNYAIGEHLENAGVHSGDATVILPAQKLYVATIRQVKLIASLIAKALRITGPFNIQFMAKGNEVYVIECNLRASRTFPFVSKTLNHNFISLATRAMTGMDAKPYKISLLDIDYVCVKVRSDCPFLVFYRVLKIFVCSFSLCNVLLLFYCRRQCFRSRVFAVPILPLVLRWLPLVRSHALVRIHMRPSSRLFLLLVLNSPPGSVRFSYPLRALNTGESLRMLP